MTGPPKRNQVGTKYIISQNGKYLEFFILLVCVNYEILPIKLCSNDKTFTLVPLADH